VIQGAAAECFKAWAATVRARLAETDARIVLCLHDELLVHAPEADGGAIAALVEQCLGDATARWAPAAPPVRFVADVSVVRRWSDVP
jgi:DNA polymerase-1